MYEALKELMADEINAAINAAEKNAEQKGWQEGLKALIDTLKGMLPDFDSVYQRVVKNDIYANVTKEQVMKYWQ